MSKIKRKCVCYSGAEDRFKGISYYSDIDDEERLRREMIRDGFKIIKERMVDFTDGTQKTQFTVILPDYEVMGYARHGIRGFMVPASDAAIERQREAGRFLSPYVFVEG